MLIKKLLIVTWCCFIASFATAQKSDQDADIHSFNLYNTGNWKRLLSFGKEQIAQGTDFPLLRMRTGYAAFMLGNYSESMLQYGKVYMKDTANKTALYYLYLNNLYLGNDIAANYYAPSLAEIPGIVKRSPVHVSALQMEYSYKMPADTGRKNAQYARIGFNLNLTNRLQLQQSVAYFTQYSNIPVVVNSKIYQKLNQPEYYAKLVYSLSAKLSLTGVYHFLNDHFPDTSFNTNIFMGGIKFTTPYIRMQVNASFAKFNSDYKQYDGILSIYPLGNLGLYTISRINVGTQSNFLQVVGGKVLKNIWLEGNATMGRATYLFENDALYVKNDLDPSLFKCGVSTYITLSAKALLTLNYSFEQKEKYKYSPTIQYSQHSINGGLSWKF